MNCLYALNCWKRMYSNWEHKSSLSMRTAHEWDEMDAKERKTIWSIKSEITRGLNSDMIMGTDARSALSLPFCHIVFLSVNVSQIIRSPPPSICLMSDPSPIIRGGSRVPWKPKHLSHFTRLLQLKVYKPNFLMSTCKDIALSVMAEGGKSSSNPGFGNN